MAMYSDSSQHPSCHFPAFAFPFRNKALVVEAGLLAKLPSMVDSPGFSMQEELATLLLSISSLAKTRFPISPSRLLPFLIKIIDSTDTCADEHVKATCLAALCNLSTKLDSVKLIVSDHRAVVHRLLALSVGGEMTSEAALATLANLALSSKGKKAIEEDALVPEALMEVMARSESLRCQELSAYVLMVVSHCSSSTREKMATPRMAGLLVEAALTGSSPVARKRAAKMLWWLKGRQNETTKRSSAADERRMTGSSVGGGRAEECKRLREAVRKMVKQSLGKTMEAIFTRAKGL